jgi:hypothetical protein
MAAAAGGFPGRALPANLVTERAASELKWDKARAASAAPAAA